MKWKRADGFTKDCFNRWGVYQYTAILMINTHDKNGVKYDATILKHDDGTYIPCRGGCKEKPVARLRDAKAILERWLIVNTH